MKEKDKKKENKSENIAIPREMFEEFSKLNETVSLQQKLIEKLMDEKKESKK